MKSSLIVDDVPLYNSFRNNCVFILYLNLILLIYIDAAQ
jgi:hypothetical protein